MKREFSPLIERAFGIAADTADYMLPYCDLVTVQPGNVVYYQDDPTTQMFVLVKGHVRLTYINENGMVILLSVVPPGQSFGEVGAADRSAHCDTAFASGPVQLISIDTACLRSAESPATALNAALAAQVSRRHRSHMDLTRALYMPSLALRLSHILLRMIDLLGNKIRYQGRLVDCLGPVVTQQDLGSMARGTRENVNKTLRGWERQGLIALEDRHILILDNMAISDIAANIT